MPHLLEYGLPYDLLWERLAVNRHRVLLLLTVLGQGPADENRNRVYCPVLTDKEVKKNHVPVLVN